MQEGNIMSVSSDYNRTINQSSRVQFKSEQPQSGMQIVTKPIDKVEDIVNTTVDTFVPEPKDEEKKKSYKTAIRVGSTVLVLSAFVALLNPKFSTSLVNKLKTKSTKAGNKAKIDDSLMGKWHKFKEKALSGLTNGIQVINNGNSVKDELFKKLCDKTSATKKLHKSITHGFDKISKQTVYSKHKSAKKQIDVLNKIINQYKNRLSEADKKLFEEKIAQINKIQEYFTPQNTKQRLEVQENLMQNLEKEITNKIKLGKDTVIHRLKGNKLPNEMKLKDSYNFWAEDALMTQRTQLEKDGEKIINSLVGDGKTQKGAYREVIELLRLNEHEKAVFEESIKNAEKRLRKANKTECVEYFDKKRDLMLGSAPTDVLTAVLSLIASGIAIGTADSRQDRISRTISGVLPVVAGMGVSTALTAMLFSGGKGMALGFASSMALSGMGSAANRILFPKNNQNNVAENKEEKTSDMEVKNA